MQLPGFRTLSRRELYDLVWSKPLHFLAIDFGIADGRLARLCASHSIPLPPRGYWRLKTRPAPPPLRRTRRKRGPIVIEPRPVKPQEDLPDPGRKARVADPPGYIAAAKAHRWIRASVRSLRQHTQIPETALACGEGLCGVECRKVDTYRAVRLLDGLARALEGRGLELQGAGDRMKVALAEAAIEVRLRGGEDGYFELWMVGHTRRKWRDTEERLLEQLIPRIAIELEVVVRHLDAKRGVA